MTLLYVNDDDENPAGSDTTLRDAPPGEKWTRRRESKLRLR
jgi:hypothetical protein